jgi:hypothetical protein
VRRGIAIKTLILVIFFALPVLLPLSWAATGDRVIEQTEYWARPGKAEEVYRWRIHACVVREKLGLPRGRVFRRQNSSNTLPDVVWQIEYPDEAARQHDLAVRDQSPQFKAVRDHMDALIVHFERGFWKAESR